MALSSNDVKIILGMSARGDKKHDIAAWFGENQARIAEAEAGEYGVFEMAPADQLPPKGAPGPKGRYLKAFVEKAVAALEAGKADEASKALKDGLVRYNRHE